MHEAATQPMCTKRQPGEMADAHHVPFGPLLAKFVAGQELLMLMMRTLWALFWPPLSEWWLAAAADAHDACLKIPPGKEQARDQVPGTRMKDRSEEISRAIADQGCYKRRDVVCTHAQEELQYRGSLEKDSICLT